MRISGHTSVFLNTPYRNISTQKSKANKSDFATALQGQYVSPETKRAADMTEAIEALDKALEKAREEKLLSEAQVDWLRHRYDFDDMAVQRDTVRTVDAYGTVTEASLGISYSEAHTRLLTDLHALGWLSDRDMELLAPPISHLRAQAIPLELVTPDDRWMVYDNGRTTSWVVPLYAQSRPSWLTFFEAPNWENDIVGYHRAIAERHIAIFELLESNPKRIMPNSAFMKALKAELDISDTAQRVPNSWYRESAEARNRLADIMAQIFG